MNAVNGWENWNPAHFLDTGEMTAAVGLTYDWLYNDLSEAQKTSIIANTTIKGFTPFAVGYQNKTSWWQNNTINWNCVCASGGIVGSLAFGGEAKA
jgi:hypothetical protein